MAEHRLSSMLVFEEGRVPQRYAVFFNLQIIFC